MLFTVASHILYFIVVFVSFVVAINDVYCIYFHSVFSIPIKMEIRKVLPLWNYFIHFPKDKTFFFLPLTDGDSEDGMKGHRLIKR